MKKLLPIEDYKKELLERFIEFRDFNMTHADGPYHRMADLFSEWAFADDVRKYAQLRYSLVEWYLIRDPKFDKDKAKEKIINGVFELIGGISDHGLINSKTPEGQLIIKKEKKDKEKALKKIRNIKKKPILGSKQEKEISILEVNSFVSMNNGCIHSIFEDMSLEEMLNWFEDFEHLDWFMQYWEIPVLGSGTDLVDLTNYAFMGYLNCSFDGFDPWTLRTLCNHRHDRGMTKRIDPVKYIEELIKNCNKFVAEHPGDRSALGDGNLLFKKVIRHAETRLQLDTKKYVLADDFAYITGINIRTLSNIGLIQPKKPGEEAKILSKDALNFILKNKKPDGSKIRNTRNRDMADDGSWSPKYKGLTRSFYSSIWQEQVFYSISVSIDWFDGPIFWKPITCFKEINKFKSNTVLRKTNKNLSPRMAIHNRTRVEWIGDGKTFEEINSPDSPYRNNIKRKTYKGNKSSIIEDLEYDLNKDWLKL